MRIPSRKLTGITLFAVSCLLLLQVARPCRVAGQGQQEILGKYLNSITLQERERAAKAILKARIPFDSVYHALRKGRTYSAFVPKGFQGWERRTKEGIHLFALALIPQNYTPEKQWPVRVVLHGDISHMDSYNVFRFIDTTLDAYKNMQEIRIYPSGYFAARWYYRIQYENVMYLLDSVKKIYNVDENLVSLSGFSDGGTGTFAFANYDVTPFQCFMPFIGSCASLKVLGTKQVYFNNFRNKPFFIENGRLDETFPPQIVLPYVDQLMRLNAEVSFFMIDTGGHNLKWMPMLKDSINSFIQKHRRNPHPEHLIWQTESKNIFNRNHWLVITETGTTVSQASELIDYNEVVVNGQYKQAFRRDSLAGLIEAAVSGNTITVRTKNVVSYSILLSPDLFDLSAPVRIITNDLLSYEGIPGKSAEVLLKWNMKDNDRTMLYGAELNIQPGKSFTTRQRSK